MIDIVKAMALDNFMDILVYVKENPGSNAWTAAKALGLHIVTIQRTLDVVEKYGFIEATIPKKAGRPAKAYSYRGGSFTVDLDELLASYELRKRRIRERGRADISFSFDIDREQVNAILIGGKQGRKVPLDDKTGRMLWLVPPPDSEGEKISVLADAAGIAVVDAVRFVDEMLELGVVEVLP